MGHRRRGRSSFPCASAATGSRFFPAADLGLETRLPRPLRFVSGSHGPRRNGKVFRSGIQSHDPGFRPHAGSLEPTTAVMARTHFGLPNLQARRPWAPAMANGLSPRTEGELGGEYTVLLAENTMAEHNHRINCVRRSGSSNTPTGNFWASAQGDRNAPHLFVPTSTPANMNAAAVGNAGGGVPHNNLPPYLTVCFVIGLQGIYPARG